MFKVNGHGDPAAVFDAALRARAPAHGVRPEAADDHPFLAKLFAAVSPMRDQLPARLLSQQAEAADAHFQSAFPNAMRRILTRDQAPVGRIVVDWTQTDHVVGVDIAVLPAARGAGLALLRAWLATADALERSCRLTVVSANPARAVYARLGFREVEIAPDSPLVAMIRPFRPVRSSTRTDRC